jgi:hypothetical protein
MLVSSFNLPNHSSLSLLQKTVQNRDKLFLFMDPVSNSQHYTSTTIVLF